MSQTALPIDLAANPKHLWSAGEKKRRAQKLVTASASLPRLPKMLNSEAIYETLAAYCREGIFVLGLTRPDRSQKNFWRHVLSDLLLDDPALEVVLPQAASLIDLPAGLLKPGNLSEFAQNDVKSSKLKTGDTSLQE